ncbi:hypothetical protein ACQW5G_01230 [Fructilactobacillus sp. Tb1]|uniref:hypothetical protein n=1 Tax=Fructilactobacillus sp. Tb1 TaxID=3422304 RepID=UPI003D2C1CF0
MINYTETPDLQRKSKEIMTYLQRRCGIDKVLAQDDKLILIGDDWCYKADNEIDLVTSAVAIRLFVNMLED